MKYIFYVWDKKHDGVLFFLQRLEEMLFHYSSDIVRAPVHNTSTLLDEYLRELKEVKANRVKQYQIEQIWKELGASLKKDRILLKEYGADFIQDVCDYSQSKRDDIVTYLRNKINPEHYVEICRNYIIDEVVSPNHKEEIEFGLRAWIASIVRYGYSSEYIYTYLHKVFDNAEDPIKILSTFLEHFDLIEREYCVYFVFNKSAMPYEELLTKRLRVSFIDEKEYRGLYTKGDGQKIGYVTVKEVDAFTALNGAYESINVFLKYYQVLTNRTHLLISKHGLVCNQEMDECFIRKIMGIGFRSIEREKSQNLGDEIDSIIMGCQSKSRTSNRQISKMISLHNASINQNDLKEGFVGLWSILEVIAVNSSDENKIAAIIDRIVPILQQDYLLALFEDIHTALRDNLQRETYQGVYSQISDFEGNYLRQTMALVFLDDYEKLRENLFVLLQNYPIIRNKIYVLYELREDRRQLLNLSKRYAQRVTWHLYRLYRARNAIVHSGETPEHLQVLGEHLHLYVDSVLEEILYKLSFERTLFSIKDVLTDAALALHRKDKFCAETGKIDEEIISLISSPLYWESARD